jgi:hypothetical protein
MTLSRRPGSVLRELFPLKHPRPAADCWAVNGQRVLAQVIRTQAATARPGFDVDDVLQGVVDEAQALTGAEAAEVVLRGRGRITSERRGPNAASTLEVPLPPSAPTEGALAVYSSAERRFSADDRQVLELLAGLIGATLTRAALDARSPFLVPRHH